MHLRLQNNFDILIRSVRYLAKLQIAKIHKNAQNIKYYLYKASWEFDFYTPVFRRDVLWYGGVRPGLRPSDSPSVRLSVRPSVRPTDSPSGSPSSHFPHFSPTSFDILSWNFNTWLCFDVLQIKFECRHFALIFDGVMPFCELRI